MATSQGSRTYHKEKRKGGGDSTPCSMPHARGPGTEEQAWFSLEKVHVCLRCSQVSRRARASGTGSHGSSQSSSKAAQVLHPGAVNPSGQRPRRCSLPALPRDESHLLHTSPTPKASGWKQQGVLHAEAPQGYGHRGRDMRTEEERGVLYTFARRQPEMYNPARKAERFPPVNPLPGAGSPQRGLFFAQAVLSSLGWGLTSSSAGLLMGHGLATRLP